MQHLQKRKDVCPGNPSPHVALLSEHAAATRMTCRYWETNPQQQQEQHRQQMQYFSGSTYRVPEGALIGGLVVGGEEDARDGAGRRVRPVAVHCDVCHRPPSCRPRHAIRRPPHAVLVPARASVPSSCRLPLSSCRVQEVASPAESRAPAAQCSQKNDRVSMGGASEPVSAVVDAKHAARVGGESQRDVLPVGVVRAQIPRWNPPTRKSTTVPGVRSCRVVCYCV